MPSMLKAFGILLLAQLSVALVIINNYPSPGNLFSSALQGQELNPNFNPSKCLDVKGGVFADGTPVQIFDCNGTPSQRWQLNHGSTAVQLAGTNFCLDAGANPANGVPLKIWTCFDNLPAQEWFYTNDNRIALENQGFCTDLTNGDLSNGNDVQIWQCTDNDNNQVWTTSAPLKSSSPFTFPVPNIQVIID